MKPIFRTILLMMMALLLAPALAGAFDKNDSTVKPCTSCHTITREEVAALVGTTPDNVAGISSAPLRGFWEVGLVASGKVYPVYVDYSKKYLLQGQIMRFSDKENLTRARFEELNRIDVSSIPLQNAVVIGKSSSARKIIVLTDPSCAYCVKLHKEIKEAVAKDPEAAFYIMPYSRDPNDKSIYNKCLAAVCDKSGKILDDIYAGKPAPPPTCKSNAVDEAYRLAGRLQIQGTPSMVLPDGRLISGYRSAEDLLKLTK